MTQLEPVSREIFCSDFAPPSDMQPQVLRDRHTHVWNYCGRSRDIGKRQSTKFK